MWKLCSILIVCGEIASYVCARVCLWVCIWPWTRFHRNKMHNREPWPLWRYWMKMKHRCTTTHTCLCLYHHWKALWIPSPIKVLHDGTVHRSHSPIFSSLIFICCFIDWSMPLCKASVSPGNILIQSVVCACVHFESSETTAIMPMNKFHSENTMRVERNYRRSSNHL